MPKHRFYKEMKKIIYEKVKSSLSAGRNLAPKSKVYEKEYLKFCAIFEHIFSIERKCVVSMCGV